ncbi:hypothetical protein E1B28_002820 [Marasmius oreades]|nr:uncharacterized protein E1B28_002820 [Marasmius oreades]KAG7086902.1 hypothetical protein E1B28_002820 [Marasmius oreades]
MVAHDAMQTFGHGFGRLDVLNDVQNIWFHACVLDGIIACVIQISFAYRIYLLSHSKIIPAVVSLLALNQCAAAVTTGALAKINGTVSNISFDRTMRPVAGLWLGGSALCDILIALTLTYVLSKFELSKHEFSKHSSFTETRDRIKRIIRLTMETGSLTAIIATTALILFIVFPFEDYEICPAIILAKMYSNSLMVMFNSRIQTQTGLGQRVDASGESKLEATVVSLAHRNTDARMGSGPVGVRVDETTSGLIFWNGAAFAMEPIPAPGEALCTTSRSSGLSNNV